MRRNYSLWVQWRLLLVRRERESESMSEVAWLRGDSSHIMNSQWTPLLSTLLSWETIGLNTDP